MASKTTTATRGGVLVVFTSLALAAFAATGTRAQTTGSAGAAVRASVPQNAGLR